MSCVLSPNSLWLIQILLLALEDGKLDNRDPSPTKLVAVTVPVV